MQKRKQKQGVVLNTSGLKTLAVLVRGMKRHISYGKVMKFSVKYMAHDDEQLAKVGDTVIIEECRPISKSKKWRVVSCV